MRRCCVKMHEKKICPYCGGEMEKGMIRSGQEISWSDKKYFFNRAMFHKKSVLLGELDFLRGTTVEAWLCRACRKVIIDYDEDSGEE